MAVGPHSWGIFAFINGSLIKVADHNTAIPDSWHNFMALEQAQISGQNLVFYNWYHDPIDEGIYALLNGSLVTIADSGMPDPSGFGEFLNFNHRPSISGENIAFIADTTQGRRSIYLYNNNSLNSYIEPNVIYHGYPKILEYINEPVIISGKNLVFSYDGIFAFYDGMLLKIIEPGSLLDNKLIKGIRYGSNSFDENKIAFHASFDDGSEGIYVAQIAPTI